MADDLGFVHRFVPGNGTTRTTLLLLHGTGGNEDDLVPLGAALLPGAALLSPRGRVLERGMPRFFRRLAEGVFDLEDLALRTDELATFVRAAAGSYDLDAQRIVAVGYSNGANIAASVILKHPHLLAGGALLHPMVPFEPEQPPQLAGRQIFISAGEVDPMVPAALTRRLEEILRAGGASVETHWEPGGHSLVPGEVAAAQSWLARSFA
jgi:phospholipase/carboxylesterase